MSHATTIPMNLHAELLPNIRQITLYISLPVRVQFGIAKGEPESESEPEISVSLSEPRRAVTVTVTPSLLPEQKQKQKHLEDVRVSETLKLPARVSEAARNVFQNITKQRAQVVRTDNNNNNEERREYSFRMPLDSENDSASSSAYTTEDDFVPWTAKDMHPFTKVRCRVCGNGILESSSSATATATGWTWKDLPSGNWAEMMDFWHCHKPDPHDHGHDDDHTAGTTNAVDNSHSIENGKLVQEQNALVKGYGAANRVVAMPGTVLVDVASFLVVEGDCRGLKKVEKEHEHEHPTKPSSLESLKADIICTKCGTLIGTEDIMANGWRLLKANLSVHTPSSEQQSTQRESESDTQEPSWETHSAEILVAAQILEMIERESVRRFVVHPSGAKNGLLLWIFNPDLRYSNTSTDDTHTQTHTSSSRRAMKVFFKAASDVEALLNSGGGGESGTTSTTPFSLEELELPFIMFEEISRVLVESNQMLPVSARRFREWKVGLLGRFEREMSKGEER